METMSEFKSRSILITGAGGGLGRALVDAFADRGARVIGCDLSLGEMDGLPLDARHAFDLSDHAAIEAATQVMIEKDGLPDVVVNNAGWTRAETMDALTAATIGTEIDLNLTGVAIFANALLKPMLARGSGNFVFISSVNALSHLGNPAYAAAKAGINAIARAIAVEYGRRGIRSNVVCPGSIRTPAWDHRLAKDAEILGKLQRLYPLGRIVEAREVAEAVAFLASDRASGITGTVLPVDAGLTAGSLPFIDDILGGNSA
ncbi:SDR family oxidoreductase [Rhizobiaceae bacterium n13]|uniref:SDR family oxidoreductase n=1 Tax=Ferirhizobium litorale TaxID=2927786 RepID=A0AAE3QEY1_9HYPH|nr:SDR family oxidoreductase [Fererhizobium litorale]MDI7862040.1 SDR family oxidoreductase [Fererhizobium litorale]MDI7922688.1 SDR family oxidoreductase [Fererhizobium litorale]